jgi:hypothetical protein
VIVPRRLPCSLRSGPSDPRAGRRASNQLLPHLLSSITDRGCMRGHRSRTHGAAVCLRSAS